MLKKILSCMLSFILCSYSAFSRDSENIVHIYYMHELQPTLFMTADILKRPKNELKVAFDSNIPVKNDYNVIPLKMKLENATEIQNGTLYKRADFKEFKKIYNQNKNSKFIIHSGLFASFNRIIPFLNYIPKEKIKEIHLYESSAGRLKNDWNVNSFTFNKAELEFCLKHHCIRHSDLLFSLGILYPTVYHIGYLDELKKDENYKTFWENLSNTNTSFALMDFNELTKELTLKQKKQLFSWYGFDYKSYKSEIKGKKTEMFIVGHAAEQEKEKEVVAAILDWFRSHRQDMNTNLYVKWGRNKKLQENFNKKFRNLLKSFPNVPFELLILCDLLPDKISGTPSTLFFHLSPENIGNIYNLPRKKHIEFLLKKNKISKEQIINL